MGIIGLAVLLSTNAFAGFLLLSPGRAGARPLLATLNAIVAVAVACVVAAFAALLGVLAATEISPLAVVALLVPLAGTVLPILCATRARRAA